MANHILWLNGIQKLENFEIFQLGGWLPQNFSDPFISEKVFKSTGSIGFEKYASSPEISKMFQYPKHNFRCHISNEEGSNHLSFLILKMWCKNGGEIF